MDAPLVGHQLADDHVCFGVVKGAKVPDGTIMRQGFNIKLPHEQALSPALQQSAEMAEFLLREHCLMDNAVGHTSFPGGYGTVDEALILLALKKVHGWKDPVHFAGTKYWGPILDTAIMKRCVPEGVKLFGYSDANLLELATIMQNSPARGFEGDPVADKKRLAREIVNSFTALYRMKPAVSFYGGYEVPSGHPSLGMAKELASALAKEGLQLRVSGGIEAQTVIDGALAGDSKAVVQGVPLKGEPLSPQSGLVIAHESTDFIIQQELATHNITGMVFLAGGVKTYSHLFSLLCEMQTGKVPKAPIILLGNQEESEELFRAIKNVMLKKGAETISPPDLDLVRPTDDPAKAAKWIIEFNQAQMKAA
jgi:predicted Rossmann-fold nucleotide-binding protein